MTAPTVSTEDLAAALDAGPVPLVDVRQPEEYDAVHVPGATLMPMGEVVARAGELTRDATVFVICATGARSQRAADYYRSLGIEAVNVAGGTNAWVEEGRPAAYGRLPG